MRIDKQNILGEKRADYRCDKGTDHESRQLNSVSIYPQSLGAVFVLFETDEIVTEAGAFDPQFFAVDRFEKGNEVKSAYEYGILG